MCINILNHRQASQVLMFSTQIVVTPTDLCLSGLEVIIFPPFGAFHSTAQHFALSV